jgi:hypothetical protein
MQNQIRLRPEMGEAILEHLRKRAPLPKYGVLAGQAVASAIDDLWGRGGGVYNDLDVFIPCEEKHVSAGRDRVIRMATRVRAVPVAEQDYEGVIQRHLELLKTYQITGVSYDGLVNKVFFTLPKNVMRVADHTRRVIAGFDINAVRVGINLANGQLVWDNYYEQFLRTRELRLVAAYTPAHSFIRLLKKAQELPEVTVNLEVAARITAMLQTESLFEELSGTRLASFFFGDKMSETARQHQSEWAPYYRMDDVWFHKPGEALGWRPGAGDELAIDAKMLYRLTPRGQLDAPDEAFARKVGTISVLVLPDQVYRQHEVKRKDHVSVLMVPEVPEYLDKSFVAHFARARGADYFEGVLTPDGLAEHAQAQALSSLTVVADRDLAAFMVGCTYKEQLEMVQRFKNITAGLGILNSSTFLAELLPSSFEVLDLDRLEQAAQAKLGEQRKPRHVDSTCLPHKLSRPRHGNQVCGVEELLTSRAVTEFWEKHQVAHSAAHASYLFHCSHAATWTHRYFVLSIPAVAGAPNPVGFMRVSVDAMGKLCTEDIAFELWATSAGRYGSWHSIVKLQEDQLKAWAIKLLEFWALHGLLDHEPGRLDSLKGLLEDDSIPF